MIRNYYTEAYKGGIVPTISAANLIDGTAKVIETVAKQVLLMRLRLKHLF